MYSLILVVCAAATPYDSVAVVGGGSGVLIWKHENKGVVITNAHVCNSKTEYLVYWPAYKTPRFGTTIYVNRENDIALLVVENPPCPPIEFGKTDDVNVSVGYPYYDRKNLHFQVGKSLADGERHTILSNRLVPGFSGGPCFNSKGQIHAINKAVTEHFGVAVSDTIILKIIDKYKDPATWVENKDHLQTIQQYNNAKPDGEVRSKPYTDEDAPQFGEPDVLLDE